MNQSSYLERILGIVCSVFDAYSAVLFLPAKEAESYSLVAGFSLGDHIQKKLIISPGMGLVGWILRNQQPLLINNFDRSKSKLGYYQGDVESEIKAFMGCPLKKSLGALCLDSKRTYSFSDKDQKILFLFCDLLLDLHGQFHYAAETKDQNQYYTSLQEIYGLRNRFSKWNVFLENTLRILSSATNFTHSFLAVRDEWGETYSVEGSSQPLASGRQTTHEIPIGSGYVGWVFRNGAPVYLDEKETKGTGCALFGKQFSSPAFTNALCVPLRVHGVTRAVLGLADEQVHGIDDNLKAFVHAAADHLALFLENLYLRSRVSAITAEMQSLRNLQPPETDEPGS